MTRRCRGSTVTRSTCWCPGTNAGHGPEGVLKADSLHSAGSVLDVAAIVAFVGWTVIELDRDLGHGSSGASRPETGVTGQEIEMNSRSGGVGIVGVIVIVLVILWLVGVIRI
jgi:hypothetical protein